MDEGTEEASLLIFGTHGNQRRLAQARARKRNRYAPIPVRHLLGKAEGTPRRTDTPRPLLGLRTRSLASPACPSLAGPHQTLKERVLWGRRATQPIGFDTQGPDLARPQGPYALESLQSFFVDSQIH